ncbi:lactococcin 972 family bacteriocin [Staphylococcus rostri]|uniref:Lactococcin 972 family bacteriocin n=1 Tax=Staphylococcus rostri TaxID=522262 RepID=A0A2K3YSU6_9STAP|nr:lactococcin 972 family bacteriocin [Staphylococcus rostri]PNZ28298.1 hypothetical protein CD122_04880 [Staphylococcus rostri]
MKKNFILASVLTIGLSGLTVGGIANADVTSINGGSENVDNYNGLVRSEIPDQNTATDSTALRKVTTSPKAGGYWIRGIRGSIVISHYKHYKKMGKGTAINGKGYVGSGGWKKAGVFSKGSVEKTFSNNKTYYDHK